ncbi:MAG: MarR family transcriptional regulator [Aquihabitans sp.]
MTRSPAPVRSENPASNATGPTADRLRLAATRLARILRQQSDAGLTPTQGAALATIQRSGPIPIGALAEVEQVSPPTATKAVDKLYSAGLVERVTDPTDRRVSLVSITPSGNQLLAEIRQRKTAWLTTRLADLPSHELALLTEAIAVLEHLTSPPQRGTSPDAETEQ